MHSEVGKVLFLTTKGVSKSNYTNGAMATPNGANNMPQDATPTVLGAQIQASVQIGIGNATNKQEFSGDSLQLSAGLGAITDGGISFNINSSGIWSLQVNLGVGYGASGSGVVTNTTVQDQILEWRGCQMHSNEWVQWVAPVFWALIGIVALFALINPRQLVATLTLHAVELPPRGQIVVRCVAVFFILGVIRVFFSGMAFQSVP
jgi:hypothetical protein